MSPSLESLLAPGNLELFRGVLQENEARVPISAAGQQATRLAACADGSFVFASGSCVYRLNSSPTRKRARSEPVEEQTEHKGSDDDKAAADVPPNPPPAADDYVVPKPMSYLAATPYAIHSTHSAEVQSVTADDIRIASVDAYGRCVVTAESQNDIAAPQSDQQGRSKMKSFVLSPVSLTRGESGWAGVSLRKNDPAAALVTRQFFRDVTVFDMDVAVRTIHTIMPPYASSFCGDGGIVAVAEGHDLSLYDSRAGESRGCVTRKTLGSGNLLSMDVTDNGDLIAVGGMDRVLTTFDTRMMTARDRWPACLKYECAGTIISRSMQGMAYVCSVDNEVACGAWSSDMANALKAQNRSKSVMISGANTKSARRAFGFRADVRLTGMTRTTSTSEEIAVMSESGAFYILRRGPV